MSPVVIALVLGSALLHAAWNAILRGGADRFWSIVVMSMASAAAALPLALLLPAPLRACWPYIAVSACLQIGYCLFLARAYRDGDLAQVYPIARGTSPLLVTLGAAVAAGERLTPLVLLGVAFVSAGIIALSLERGPRRSKSSLWAIATGVFIAGYTLTDGLGARLSGHAPSYAAWLFVLQGAPMPLIWLAARGRLTIRLGDGETLKAIVGGLLSTLAYGVIIWALTLGPMGRVSALRETSILFATVLGVAFLGERLTVRRAASAVMVAAGAIILSAGA